jgi:four helix bundle protein
MQDFTKLKVWRKAFRLGIDVYRTIESGPKWTFPDMRGQTLRAAASIADTIAEGCGKESPRELARYCDMAGGSAKELLSELLRAHALKFISHQKFKEFKQRIDEIRRMLWSLAAAVRRKYPLKRARRAGDKREGQKRTDSRQSKSGE